MEIRNITLESRMVIISNNQKIYITPFLTSEPGNIKLGVDAPRGLEVNREEIYKQKQERLKIESSKPQFK